MLPGLAQFSAWSARIHKVVVVSPSAQKKFPLHNFFKHENPPTFVSLPIFGSSFLSNSLIPYVFVMFFLCCLEKSFPFPTRYWVVPSVVPLSLATVQPLSFVQNTCSVEWRRHWVKSHVARGMIYIRIWYLHMIHWYKIHNIDDIWNRCKGDEVMKGAFFL